MINRRGFLQSVAWFGASMTSMGAYAMGVEPMLRLTIARYHLTPRGWPPDLKLRIVALADIHACEPWMSPRRVAGIVSHANALGGDIVLLLGDYVMGSRMPHRAVPAASWAAELAQLHAPLGVHAVMGNHDWWQDEPALLRRSGPTFAHVALAQAGVNVLENDAVRLVHRGQPFWLAGLGDQIAFQQVRGRRGQPRGVDDMPGTLSKLADDAPAILLAHEPDIFPRVPSRFCLTLSGHTHGGQINLFGWRPAAASDLSEIYARGHFHERDRDLIVSSGLGCSIAPLRFGVPPEIMVVELGGLPVDSPA
jgi:uncharacterized protein